MLHILEDVVVPAGQEPSAWQGDQILAVVEVVQSSGNTVLATGDADGLTVELPFQSETSLLTVATRESHPQLGNGVLIKLTLPVLFSEQDGPRFASELNRRELESLTRSHFLGSWCWHDEFVHYVTFLPNVLNLGEGDLFNFLGASYGRAKWVAETIYGDDWESNRDEAGRPLATPGIGEMLGDPESDEPQGRLAGSLGRRLFESDVAHEAYWGAVRAFMQSADDSTVPGIARQMALNHLQHVQSLTGLDVTRWDKTRRVVRDRLLARKCRGMGRRARKWRQS